MLSRSIGKRFFSEHNLRVVKQKVPNPNVTPHNPEHRPGYTDFSFMGSFNMGYEGFSRPLSLARSNPIYGTKNEYLFLLVLFLTLPCWAKARKNQEDVLRADTKATNRYAVYELDNDLRHPSKWTL